MSFFDIHERFCTFEVCLLPLRSSHCVSLMHLGFKIYAAALDDDGAIEEERNRSIRSLHHFVDLFGLHFNFLMDGIFNSAYESWECFSAPSAYTHQWKSLGSFLDVVKKNIVQYSLGG